MAQLLLPLGPISRIPKATAEPLFLPPLGPIYRTPNATPESEHLMQQQSPQPAARSHPRILSPHPPLRRTPLRTLQLLCSSARAPPSSEPSCRRRSPVPVSPPVARFQLLQRREQPPRRMQRQRRFRRPRARTPGRPGRHLWGS
jgi:hypothetical protein